MANPAQSSPAPPQRIGVTLFLEHPAEIDYRRLIERVGEPLGIVRAGIFLCDLGGEEPRTRWPHRAKADQRRGRFTARPGLPQDCLTCADQDLIGHRTKESALVA